MRKEGLNDAMKLIGRGCSSLIKDMVKLHMKTGEEEMKSRLR